LRSIRGLSSFDFRKRSALRTAGGKGKALLGNASGPLDALMGGWQLGSILTLQDGFPLTATCGSGNIQNDGDTCLADATGINPNLLLGQQDPNQWFYLAAFVEPATRRSPIPVRQCRPRHDDRAGHHRLGLLDGEELPCHRASCARIPALQFGLKYSF
jgi:hypothetical protein